MTDEAVPTSPVQKEIAPRKKYTRRQLLTVEWRLRPGKKFPNGRIWITGKKKDVNVEYWPNEYKSSAMWGILPRRDARLLAERILQALEES